MEVDYLPSCDRIKLYLSKGSIVCRQTLRSTGAPARSFWLGHISGGAPVSSMR